MPENNPFYLVCAFGFGIAFTMIVLSYFNWRANSNTPRPLMPDYPITDAFPEYTFEEIPKPGTYWVEFGCPGEELTILPISNITHEQTNGSRIRYAMLGSSRISSDMGEIKNTRFYGPIPEPRILRHHCAA